jgi:hypothetical protein
MKKRREATPEQKARAEERRAKFRTLWKQIGNMPELERIQMANKLGIVNCEGHTLSVKNQCLIAFQTPGASVVGGFRQWLKQGRAVKKGEHGAMIWIKAGQRKSEDASEAPESDDPRFVTGTVFDIGQTQPVEQSAPAEESEGA